MNKKNKKVAPNCEILILDLSDAILPENWPTNIPLQINVTKGNHDKSFDIVENDTWFPSLRTYVEENSRYLNVEASRKLPIGINENGLLIGSHISDQNGNIIIQGKNKKAYLEQKQQKENETAATIASLKEKYPLIKDSFIIEFNDTVNLLLKDITRPIDSHTMIYDTFNDIFIAGGGSLYPSGATAALGAYSSVIDFDALNAVLQLFEPTELKLLKDGLSDVGSYSPLHSLMAGWTDTFILKQNKPNSKPKHR